MKTLVVYYSFTGKTGIVAEALCKALPADQVCIKDVAGRKGFKGMVSLMKETRGGVLPGIEPSVVDMSSYDRVFLGMPNWGGTPPATVSSFIDKNDFTGKQVVLFVVQAGMGAARVAGPIGKAVEAKGGTVKGFFKVNTFLKGKQGIEKSALAGAAKFAEGAKTVE